MLLLLITTLQRLVENMNGTIIANMRWTGSPKEGRGIATSVDGGATFSKIVYDSMLKEAVCQATIFRSPQNGDIYYAGYVDCVRGCVRVLYAWVY